MSTLALDLETDSFVLPPARLPDRATLAQALRSRASARAFAPDPLPADLVSGLLWAAFGINRPATGGRTAPSAHDWQETTVYAVLAQGCYRYEPREHRLVLVTAQDLRAATGVQDFVAGAPLNLVYVADLDRLGSIPAEERSFLVGADAGCIAQNVYLFCAISGLATVVRGLVDRRQLARQLGLRTSQRITLAQTVGWPAAAP